ncbi:MAG: hypothetical protein FWC41_06815 [Firmicutes bacterium]|nr:hypothetical protein [Bacillota bacterium]
MKIKKIGTKKVYTYDGGGLIIDWLRQFFDRNNKEIIGYLRMVGTDFQTNNQIWIANKLSDNDVLKKLFTTITKNNVVPICMYIAIRNCIKGDWLNNRDRYFYPSDSWQQDTEFHSDCLCYSLFHGSNNIQSQYGINHWIPFREHEVESREKFQSNFMCDFIEGKIKIENKSDMFSSRHSELVAVSPSGDCNDTVDDKFLSSKSSLSAMSSEKLHFSSAA